MTNLQAFLLGIMVAYSPGLIVLAILLRRVPIGLRVHVRKYTDLLMHLLRTTPHGATNAELASDLCVTIAGVKRVARKLEGQRRIVREMALRGDEYIQIWKVKQHG